MSANSNAAERFREHVWQLIAERQITITKLADDLNMGRPSLSRVLHGHEDVTFDRAEKIAHYFSRELCDFLKPAKKVRRPA